MTPQLLPRERLLHLTRCLHALGERPLYEFLREIEAGAPLQPRLEAYARLARLGAFIAAHRGREIEQPRVVAGREARS